MSILEVGRETENEVTTIADSGMERCRLQLSWSWEVEEEQKQEKAREGEEVEKCFICC